MNKGNEVGAGKSRVLALVAILLLALSGAVAAQSGRASLRGWVNFEGIAYNDEQPRATVRVLCEGEHPSKYETRTDERGRFDFELPALGRCRLEISAERYVTYSTELYLPSDFMAHWAVELRRREPPPAR
jgi:hypothetical protein